MPRRLHPWKILVASQTLLLLGWGLAAPPAARAQQAPPPPYLFLRPDVGYGSASTFGPLNVVFNRGFSLLHFRGVERDPFAIDWGRGLSNVWGALTDPGAAVERRGGVGRWLSREFFPTGAAVWTWAWAPNYTGHIVAGGITYRTMAEWFHARGAPVPRLTAATLLMGTMVVNEAIENRKEAHPSASTVSDLLIFDPLGILIFSHDGVARFFAETLHASDWSPQAAVTLPDGRVQNVAQTMAYTVPLPFTDRARVLLLIAQGSQSGLTFPVSETLNLSATVGFYGDRRRLDPVSGDESIEPSWATGIHLDRNHSLLASLNVAPDAHNAVQVNVYPGVLPARLGALGVWLTATREGDVSLGVSSRRTLGLGLGYDAAGR